MKKLDNKTAIVTGGASGIGKAIAQVLAENGATSYILDVNVAEGQKTEEDIRKNGGKAFFISCDISNQDQVKQVFQTIWQQENALDILINNAGISHIGNAENTSEADFDKIFSINIKGVYNCLHAGIPFMKDSGGGVIINMTSVAASVGLPDRFAYSMSKGAVSTMTFSVARDYINDGIRCNGIAPGRVHTPFVDGYLKKNYPGQEEEMFRKLEKTQPLGRMGKPREIAMLVLYLCSEEASFITGSILPIDGGFATMNT